MSPQNILSDFFIASSSIFPGEPLHTRQAESKKVAAILRAQVLRKASFPKRLSPEHRAAKPGGKLVHAPAQLLHIGGLLLL